MLGALKTAYPTGPVKQRVHPTKSKISYKRVYAYGAGLPWYLEHPSSGE